MAISRRALTVAVTGSPELLATPLFTAGGKPSAAMPDVADGSNAAHRRLSLTGEAPAAVEW